jgi:hypothetical protein
VQAINVRDLERFDGDVTPDTLKEAGLIKSTRIDVKILGHGDLTKKLAVSAHLFSASAREKIEQAGGSITWIRGEPAPRPPKRRERKAAPPPEEPEAEEQTAEAEEVEEPPTDEPAAQPPVRDSGPGEGVPGEPGGSPAEEQAAEEESI